MTAFLKLDDFMVKSENLTAKKIEDRPDSYTILYGKQIRKDVSEYFVEKLCRKILRESRKKPITEALEEAQRRLAEFD